MPQGLSKLVRESTEELYQKTISRFKKNVSDNNNKVSEDLGDRLSEQYQGVTQSVSNHVKANIKVSKQVTNHFIKSATQDYDFPLKCTAVSCTCALVGLGFVVADMINNKSAVSSRQSALEQIVSDFENGRCYNVKFEKPRDFRIGFFQDWTIGGYVPTECFANTNPDGSIKQFAKVGYRDNRLYLYNVFSGAEVENFLKKSKEQK